MHWRHGAKVVILLVFGYQLTPANKQENIEVKRYYFVSDDLKDLALIETELQMCGISPLQMHLVSEAEGEAERLGLHQVSSVFKRDIIQSMLTGFMIGLLVSAVLMLISMAIGLESTRDWTILGVICLFIVGFCTWEGGLFGIQVPNRHFRRFARALKQGRHLFFVDLDKKQRSNLDAIVKKHSHLKSVGRGAGEWDWWFSVRSAAYRFAK
jgi:hypothetical protein